MTDLKTKSQKTRNRLLTAASRIFAEHVVQFSLAGIQSVRAQYLEK